MRRCASNLAALAMAGALLAACTDRDSTQGASKGASTPAGEASGAGHGGPVIDLGTTTIGGFTAHATRDEGAIVAGGDAPIDVTVRPSPGSTARVAVVRFWIGLEDAQGSVKAKADVEDPGEPDRWHTHAEVPEPLPPGSRLWVEIEDEAGQRATGSFALKA